MRLKVVHENGDIETLTLRDGHWCVVQGKFLSRLRTEGVEHFFTKDGFYDGWGGAVSATPDEADRIAEEMDRKRAIAARD